ncbi:J domain-containing protein [Streptomyces sp. ZAF1911]|uniref:J domain-containing protein n=1 Tax=Streptomyces TaxID=1883 RepID=UPI00099BF9E5|nr:MULTISPECIES: J domain-containing protein [unclassified Streptomyces]MDD9380394.1 J domain-containing protein [Streptomyces sp. ZAF1911]
MSGSRPSRDHYTVLGLRAEASPEQITSAYRTLIRALHPDARPSGRPPADAELAEVIDAYQTLHDPLLRSAYDAERDQKRQATGHPVRIPVRVRSTTHAAARPQPQPAAHPRTVVYPATSQPYQDPLDRLIAWLFYSL